MKISIFGLGYVGTVSAGCLAREGHKVIGVDPNKHKVDLINHGKTPIIEKDIGDIIAAAVQKRRLEATTDHTEAIHVSGLSIVCVGTPSQMNGDLDLKFVRRVSEEIGKALKEKTEFHIVVVRSTILPGTMDNVVIPILEENSGKRTGKDFGVCYNPEFLREGSSVFDFYNPPKTVIGESDDKSGDILAALYKKFDAPLIRIDYKTAEMVKYVDNTWHALKVGFGNEIGNICKTLSIDGHQVMNIFCQDTKLNISPAYLKPGFAFGGSCLPKDLRALMYTGKRIDLELPIINSIMPSNALQIERGIQMVMEKNSKNVGVLGFSFKAGTDDLRESPVVELIERLVGKGYDLRIYDRNVNLASLVGANRDYILNVIPHIARIMVNSLEEVLRHGNVIVIGNSDPEFKNVLGKLKPSQFVIDLVGITDKRSESNQYEGICW